MKLQGEVGAVEVCGCEVKVTLVNVRRKHAAQWQEYGPNIPFRVPLDFAKYYTVGRIVRLDVIAS